MAKSTKDSDEKSVQEKATGSNEISTNDSGVLIKRPMSDKAANKEKEKNDNLIIEDLTISENHLNKSGTSKENKKE
jgi:hypothetical protein